MSQFPALNKISVLFHLQRTALHTSTKNDVDRILRQLVRLPRYSNKTIEVQIASHCIWLDGVSEHSLDSVSKNVVKEQQYLVQMYDDLVKEAKLPQSFIAGH